MKLPAQLCLFLTATMTARGKPPCPTEFAKIITAPKIKKLNRFQLAFEGFRLERKLFKNLADHNFVAGPTRELRFVDEGKIKIVRSQKLVDYDFEEIIPEFIPIKGNQSQDFPDFEYAYAQPKERHIDVHGETWKVDHVESGTPPPTMRRNEDGHEIFSYSPWRPPKWVVLSKVGAPDVRLSFSESDFTPSTVLPSYVHSFEIPLSTGGVHRIDVVVPADVSDWPDFLPRLKKLMGRLPEISVGATHLIEVPFRPRYVSKEVEDANRHLGYKNPTSSALATAYTNRTTLYGCPYTVEPWTVVHENAHNFAYHLFRTTRPPERIWGRTERAENAAAERMKDDFQDPAAGRADRRTPHVSDYAREIDDEDWAESFAAVAHAAKIHQSLKARGRDGNFRPDPVRKAGIDKRAYLFSFFNETAEGSEGFAAKQAAYLSMRRSIHDAAPLVVLFTAATPIIFGGGGHIVWVIFKVRQHIKEEEREAAALRDEASGLTAPKKSVTIEP